MSLRRRNDLSADFAPGENHIALRKDGKCYYMPRLFSSSKTFDACVPLLISDLTNSTDARTIYDTAGAHLSNVVLINNHPIRQVSVFGRVTGDTQRLFRGNDFQDASSQILLTLDDSSHATSLKIIVRADSRLYRLLMLQLGDSYGAVVEASGTILRSFDSLRILARRLHVHRDGLRDEMVLWRERLEYRRLVLLRPWIYLAARVPPLQSTERLDYRDAGIRRAQHQNLEIALRNSDSSISVEESAPINLCRLRDGLSQATDIQLVHVETSTVPVLSIFLGVLAVVRWIIHRNFRPFSLHEMYADANITLIMYALAASRLSCRFLGVANTELVTHSYDDHPADLELEMSKSFHSVRHYLQSDCQLIVVSKRYHVYSTKLGKAYGDIVDELYKVKNSAVSRGKFSVKLWIALQYDQTYSLDCKLVNGIVEHILIEHFGDREMWLYSAKTALWLYNCTVID